MCPVLLNCVAIALMYVHMHVLDWGYSACLPWHSFHAMLRISEASLKHTHTHA